MIELGGNITLINFEQIENGELIITRKVAGNYTKEISKKYQDFKKIIITIIPETKYRIKINLEKENNKESEAENSNLFFALDQALSKIIKD
jgi:hypothetical protein|tara:strand:- start:131 stop:403 length:273 start_codon:yes stop_codon:yes gene_type:complete